MKRNTTPENFERFLKDSADELQMRPAANVWGRIENRLNRRRRWVYFTSGFFLLTASLFGYIIIDHSKQPSDPFASIRSVDKNTITPADANQKSGSSIATLPAGTHTHKATNRSQQRLTTQLFQNPIAAASLETPVNELRTAAPDFMMTPVDEQQPFEKTATATATQPLVTHNEVPSIESVVNLYKPKMGRHKSEFQLFFTPTVSYRRLTENKSYLRAVPQNLATANLAPLYDDVNKMVTHKPDMGLELGFAFKFPVTHAVKLRTGMQFNITRYSIKAFTYDVPERTTIALNNRQRGLYSINTTSTYRNYVGGRTDWLQNFYFQVSAPLGVEVAQSSAKKTRLGVAATIQPTYVLGDRAYLISTDYKNYSQVPWLIRRWNANTSLEAFVSYSTGTLRWQVGPQFRYQLLSSFIEQYPVKENLFDFGLKVGVSLDKK